MEAITFESPPQSSLDEFDFGACGLLGLATPKSMRLVRIDLSSVGG